MICLRGAECGRLQLEIVSPQCFVYDKKIERLYFIFYVHFPNLHSGYSFYSIFTNALKQARRIQRDDCDEVYNEDGCNDDDDGWAEDYGFGMF
jgi:hypothetical protein